MKLTPITNPIDTKADKVHTHTTAQVTGLDDALTDANWHKGAVPGGATLDDLSHGTYHIQGGSIAENLGLPARVGSLEISPGYYGTKTATAVLNLLNGTSHEVWTNTQNANSEVWMGWRKSVLIDPASSTTNLDLRRDTTVGTRIFAGDAMIYGDTGWRDITDLYTSTPTSVLDMGEGAKLFIRRTTGDVYFRIRGPITTQAAHAPIIQLAGGWRPETDTEAALGTNAVVRHSRYWISLERAPVGGVLIGANRTVVGQWPTMDYWPTSLPGIPA